MRIRRNQLTFHNVISTTTSCKADEWYLIARDLRNAVIKNGLYGVGPVIYQTSHAENENDELTFTFYLPVNQKIDMPENKKYQFAEKFEINDGLVFRHADLEEPLEESYELLREAAESLNFVLEEPFYNIYLDVYGEGIVDIYAPIIEEHRK